MTQVDKSKEKSSWGGRRSGAGRPPGSQNKATLEEKIVKDTLRQRVLANVGGLIDAQLALAKGLAHCYRITIGERGGRSDPELVTNPDEIHEAIDSIIAGQGYGEIVEDEGGEDGESITRRYYFITTKAPDNKALDSLLDRVFGKATFSMDITSGGQPIAPTAEDRARLDRLLESE